MKEVPLNPEASDKILDMIESDPAIKEWWHYMLIRSQTLEYIVDACETAVNSKYPNQAMPFAIGWIMASAEKALEGPWLNGDSPEPFPGGKHDRTESDGF